ncbi:MULTISPECIES: hypothetical protein [Bacillus]|uniref:Immunity protein 30 domain-containing protein n=2 Tax=Bacillus cereus group TaxID=86661 RepID=A0A150B5P6_BACCE|nr:MULTISPECIES: hypothetical protein [Bacillus]AXO97092.1 hypothetical protein DY470_04935 [Bacillus anthracis]KLA15414.1 hypothetical protein B4087_0946 [Bacillus cereus]KMP55818.1 hypothetical protein TU57_16645 [Bacillus cereus]KXX99597.1 hypothetical protein AT274_08155 [Bacillus cereus]MCG3786370.1 hypothetical protein [Bacillus sp. UTDS19-33BHI26]
MLKKLENLITSADFEEVEKLFKNNNFEEFPEEILYVTYENSSITKYSFINYLLMKKESSDLHNLAFDLLVNPLCHIEGAYHSALYHAKKSVKLTKEENVDSLLQLLFLHSVPDKLISDTKAIEICNKILELDASNEIAKEAIKELC